MRCHLPRSGVQLLPVMGLGYLGHVSFLLGITATLAAGSFRPEGVDPYTVLGLKRGGDLSAAALKRAYRQAALRWHPDKVPEAERKEAEQKFIEIAWAYEVLSDPAQRGIYDVPPQPGQSFGEGAGPGGGTPGGGPRTFSMDEAAKVFRNEFGTTSDEYRDLIQHLSASSGTGDKAQWSKHAKAIAKALREKGGRGGDFTVETATADGSGKIKTSQRETKNGPGSVTRQTVTESTQTTVTGGGTAALGGGGQNAALEAHMKAHEAAVKAAQAQAAKALGGVGAATALPSGRGAEL
eukprot:CAMPEP_0180454000 /NCGR_PEP_ID=MMETSP1036_2-20121128/20058_1 /TAXON_ID=632150 /ORGANISM="Azadinium spinosum, Strain 3D9" /LENGTH=294 /DNA_ID=CAMNT_0022460517 /DNA_START=50 /DNA_END=934 /DNA_ORIENTATION=+